MLNTLSKLTQLTSVVLTVTVLNIQTLQAATVTYQFQGTTDPGSFPFPNESYSGLFSFYDSLLTGSFSGDLPISSLQFTFLSTNFTQNSALVPSVVSFNNGNFLGLNFSANTPDFSFSLIPGSVDTSDAFFSYENNSQQGGFGDVTYTFVSRVNTSIPEPSSVVGLLGLGILGIGLKLNSTISKK
jgi:hypothetical protein